MEKDKLEKLRAALESAGFALMRVEERCWTNLWANGEPRKDYPDEPQCPLTEVKERIFVDLRELPLPGKIVK